MITIFEQFIRIFISKSDIRDAVEIFNRLLERCNIKSVGYVNNNNPDDLKNICDNDIEKYYDGMYSGTYTIEDEFVVSTYIPGTDSIQLNSLDEDEVRGYIDNYLSIPEIFKNNDNIENIIMDLYTLSDLFWMSKFFFRIDNLIDYIEDKKINDLECLKDVLLNVI